MSRRLTQAFKLEQTHASIFGAELVKAYIR